MKVFIFGAGASKGSQENREGSIIAPIVDELFDSKYAEFATAVGLEASDLAGYRDAFQKTKSKNLEGWLTNLWVKYDEIQSPIGKKQNRLIFGKLTFYIWWLMQNVSDTYSSENGYRLFLQKLGQESEEHGFINFNYDTLLDRALIDSGFNLTDNLSSYKEASYAKPHGSVNWFLRKRDDDNPIAAGEQTFDSLSRFRIAANAMFRDVPIPYRLVVFEPSHNDLKRTDLISTGKFDHEYAFPFILVPLTAKLYDHFEKYKEEMLVFAQELLSRASEIYLIGYRAGDEIIKDIFRDAKDGAPLNVIGRKNAQAIYDSVLEWKPSLTKGLVSNEGFSAFINNYPV